MSITTVVADLVARICRDATACTANDSVGAVVAHDPRDGTVWVRMSSWACANEALKALNAHGISGHDLGDGPGRGAGVSQSPGQGQLSGAYFPARLPRPHATRPAERRYQRAAGPTRGRQRHSLRGLSVVPCSAAGVGVTLRGTISAVEVVAVFRVKWWFMQRTRPGVGSWELDTYPRCWSAAGHSPGLVTVAHTWRRVGGSSRIWWSGDVCGVRRWRSANPLPGSPPRGSITTAIEGARSAVVGRLGCGDVGVGWGEHKGEAAGGEDCLGALLHRNCHSLIGEHRSGRELGELALPLPCGANLRFHWD